MCDMYNYYQMNSIVLKHYVYLCMYIHIYVGVAYDKYFAEMLAMIRRGNVKHYDHSLIYAHVCR